MIRPTSVPSVCARAVGEQFLLTAAGSFIDTALRSHDFPARGIAEFSETWNFSPSQFCPVKWGFRETIPRNCLLAN
jgi:hypothetical protein